LIVSLYLDQGNYLLNGLSRKGGVKLVVHDPESPPVPDEYGVDLAPNTATSVTLHTNIINRLNFTGIF